MGLFVIALASGCVSQEKGEAGNGDDAKLQIVGTSMMVGDAIEQLVGDAAEVVTLMGPGVDPHYYIASQGDVKILRSADAVIYNGLRLEGKMSEVLQKLSESKPVIAMAEGISEDKLRIVAGEEGEELYDPHVWNDVGLWAEAVAYLSTELQKALPELAETIQANAGTYLVELEELDREAREKIAAIPEEYRMLVTSHDAFGYLGNAYNLNVRGMQGISTVTEFSLKDRVDLINFLVETQIPAVFVESSVSPKDLNAVIEGCKNKGHNLVIGGELFSDAMGARGTPEGTYLGMVRHNIELISSALNPGLALNH